MGSDANRLRELGKQILEEAHSEKMRARRQLWRKHNSFHGERPLLYLRAFAFEEFFDEGTLRCEDTFLRRYERLFRQQLFRCGLNDDTILEPWAMVESVYAVPDDRKWGVPVGLGEKPVHGGAAAYSPALLEEEDIEKLFVAPYEVREKESAERVEKLQDALGGCAAGLSDTAKPFLDVGR